LIDSCSNSADSQASSNVDGSGGSGGGDDEDWAFQDENDHLCLIWLQITSKQINTCFSRQTVYAIFWCKFV
jgi:hypothetical protein